MAPSGHFKVLAAGIFVLPSEILGQYMAGFGRLKVGQALVFVLLSLLAITSKFFMFSFDTLGESMAGFEIFWNVVS